MKRLTSQRATFYCKRVFPPLWFGFLTFVAAIWLKGVVTGEDEVSLGELLALAALALGGYVLFAAVAFDLVDEVADCGDHVLVKNGSRTEPSGMVQRGAHPRRQPWQLPSAHHHTACHGGQMWPGDHFPPAGRVDPKSLRPKQNSV
jgi:hypothetical protein